jgi:hypothetical protein
MVSTYKSTRRYYTEDQLRHLHRPENFESHKTGKRLKTSVCRHISLCIIYLDIIFQFPGCSGSLIIISERLAQHSVCLAAHYFVILQTFVHDISCILFEDLYRTTF